MGQNPNPNPNPNPTPAPRQEEGRGERAGRAARHGQDDAHAARARPHGRWRQPSGRDRSRLTGAPTLNLAYTSPISALYRPYISLHLPYIAPISPISPRLRPSEVAASPWASAWSRSTATRWAPASPSTSSSAPSQWARRSSWRSAYLPTVYDPADHTHAAASCLGATLAARPHGGSVAVGPVNRMDRRAHTWAVATPVRTMAAHKLYYGTP